MSERRCFILLCVFHFGFYVRDEAPGRVHSSSGAGAGGGDAEVGGGGGAVPPAAIEMSAGGR